jgi:uncharacterized membrane protein (UPF0127 family)
LQWVGSGALRGAEKQAGRLVRRANQSAAQYHASTAMASWITPQLRDPSSRFRLVNTRTGAAIADLVVGAFDPAARRRGLLGRDALDAGEALIIAPTNAIHTFFMRFDIDVAFVARGGRIVKIRARIPPWRIAAALGAFAVVEVAAGVFGATGTKRGDTLALLRP